MPSTQQTAAGRAATAFLLVICAWAGVAIAAIVQLSRVCAPETGCEQAKNCLVALTVAATLVSVALVRWCARHFRRAAYRQQESSTAELRRAADVLRRLRGLQESALKTRRSKAG